MRTFLEYSVESLSFSEGSIFEKKSDIWDWIPVAKNACPKKR